MKMEYVFKTPSPCLAITAVMAPNTASRIEERDDDLALLADGSGGDTKENGEHDDLEDLIFCHGIDHRAGECVIQEITQGEPVAGDHGFVGVGQRQLHGYSRFENVH